MTRTEWLEWDGRREELEGWLEAQARKSAERDLDILRAVARESDPRDFAYQSVKVAYEDRSER